MCYTVFTTFTTKFNHFVNKIGNSNLLIVAFFKITGDRSKRLSLFIISRPPTSSFTRDSIFRRVFVWNAFSRSKIYATTLMIPGFFCMEVIYLLNPTKNIITPLVGTIRTRLFNVIVKRKCSYSVYV